MERKMELLKKINQAILVKDKNENKENERNNSDECE